MRNSSHSPIFVREEVEAQRVRVSVRHGFRNLSNWDAPPHTHVGTVYLSLCAPASTTRHRCASGHRVICGGDRLAPLLVRTMLNSRKMKVVDIIQLDNIYAKESL